MAHPLILKQFSGYPNVGDVASKRIVSKLLKRDDILVFGPDPLHAPNLLAIGSILNWADANSVVWGSGCIAADALPAQRPRAIAAVRGPLTCDQLKRLGVAAPATLGDPGALIGDLYPNPNRAQSNLFALVPHYTDLEHPFVHAARQQGALVVSPLLPLDDFVDALTTAEVVISSSLHGIVFAHAFGRPAAWVELSDDVIGGGFKFWDYFASIGIAGDDVPHFTAGANLMEASRKAALPRAAIDLQALRQSLLSAAHLLDRS